MLCCLAHERYYLSGTFAHERLGLAVGWTGLKDSFSDCLPVWNENRDICLIFSGEDFADQRLVATSSQRGTL